MGKNYYSCFKACEAPSPPHSHTLHHLNSPRTDAAAKPTANQQIKRRQPSGPTTHAATRRTSAQPSVASHTNTTAAPARTWPASYAKWPHTTSWDMARSGRRRTASKRSNTTALSLSGDSGSAPHYSEPSHSVSSRSHAATTSGGYQDHDYEAGMGDQFYPHNRRTGG